MRVPPSRSHNSHPSSPAAPPEPHRLTPRLPRSRGTAAAGPHAAMPGDTAGGHSAAGKTPTPRPEPLPGRARPLPPGGRGRHREPAAPASVGAPLAPQGRLPDSHPPPGRPPPQPVPWVHGTVTGGGLLSP